MRFRLTVKEISILALLTACNSVFELTAGNLCHLLGVPMKGVILLGINILIYAMVRSYVPRFGAITLVGAGTVFVNFVISGGFKFFALYMIFLEALSVDIVLALGGLNCVSLIVAGAIANLVVCLCSLFNWLFIYGGNFIGALNRLAGTELGLNSYPVLLIGSVFGFRMVVGMGFAYVAYRMLDLLKPALETKIESDSEP